MEGKKSYPQNSHRQNGYNHWQAAPQNWRNETNSPSQLIQPPSHQGNGGYSNYQQTWSPTVQQSARIPPTSAMNNQQPNTQTSTSNSSTGNWRMDQMMSPGPGWEKGTADNNWMGAGHPPMKTEPLSPTALSASSASNCQDGMSAAGIAAGNTGRGRRSNGKMSSQTPVMNDNPWVQIMEQPKSRGLRFRYECEGRSAGSIPGERSQIEKKSFPSIKIHSYQGTAVVVVSCVTKDNPPKPHPHSLVGKGCDKGVYTQKIKSHDMVASFPHLGIQCAKRKDVDDALKQRESIRVDPFSTGFNHKANQIDLNVVRLCFQVFLPDSSGRFTRIVAPVVSNPIYDKKAAGDLVICRLDKHAGSVRGGDEVFLLCEKVTKDDIKVRFYEEDEDGSVTWEAYGDFGASDVHRQYAIVFKAPPYRDRNIERPVTVHLQLVRPSDEEMSDPKEFMYKPEDHDPEYLLVKKKRKVASMDPLLEQAHLASIPSTVPIDPSGADAEMTDVSMPSVKERVKLKAARNMQTKQEVPSAATSSPAMDQFPVYDMTGTTDAALQQMGYTSSYQIQAPPASMYYSYQSGDVQTASTEGMTTQQLLDTLSAGGLEQINSSDSAELRQFIQEFPSIPDGEGGSLLTSLEPLDVAANVSVGDEQSMQTTQLKIVSQQQS